jgi:hypothetical protein
VGAFEDFIVDVVRRHTVKLQHAHQLRQSPFTFKVRSKIETGESPKPSWIADRSHAWGVEIAPAPDAVAGTIAGAASPP